MRLKHYSLSKILEMNNCYLSPVAVFKALVHLGYIENAEYMSSTGTGEIKKYRRFTDKGLTYGINKKSFNPNSTKTECRFNDYNFEILLTEITDCLNAINSDELDDICGKFSDRNMKSLKITISAD